MINITIIIVVRIVLLYFVLVLITAIKLPFVVRFAWLLLVIVATYYCYVDGDDAD